MEPGGTTIGGIRGRECARKMKVWEDLHISEMRKAMKGGCLRVGPAKEIHAYLTLKGLLDCGDNLAHITTDE